MDIWIRLIKSFTGEAGLLIIFCVYLVFAACGVRPGFWLRRRGLVASAGAAQEAMNRSKGKVGMLGLACLCLTMGSCSGFPEIFAKPLVEAKGDESHPACRDKEKDVILVLGGGAAYPRQPGEASFGRLMAAASLAQELDRNGPANLTVIFSGGVTFPETGLSEAAILAWHFERYGPAQLDQEGERVFLEEDSTTTYENLRFVARDYGALLRDARIWLVTSAEHMLRARLTAQGQGLSVCPYPSPPARYRPVPIFGFSTLARTAQVVHEYFGLFSYALLGRFQV